MEIAIGLIVLALIVIFVGPASATQFGRLVLNILRGLRRSSQSIRKVGIRSEE